MKTRLLILIIALGTLIFPYAAAYHEEREQMEISQMTGIFNSEMDMVMFPLVEKEYHLQVVLRDQSQYENSTVTLGYGFNFMDRIPNKISTDSSKPFMGFEKLHSTSSTKDSKTIQTNQYEFPIFANFTITFEKPGVYHYSYFEHKKEPNGASGSSSGGIFVVSKYSKAINENGTCKNSQLLTLVKHDFSTLVCVSPETHHELITRGWAPLPD